MNNNYFKQILLKITTTIFPIRKFNNYHLKKFGLSVKEKKILEIGSGKKVNGAYPYSSVKFFDKSNTFIMSDINSSFGHKIVDICNTKYKNEFDLIICASVLEHIFNVNKAINNIYRALKKDGIAIIVVPSIYPLHDEPQDYWRFTEYSIKLLLKKFKNIKVKTLGIKQFPIAYFIEAKK